MINVGIGIEETRQALNVTSAGGASKHRGFNGIDEVFGLIENSPTNIMYCGRDLVIRYINPASRKTLSQVQHLLPVPVSEIEGQKIDIFHKNPSHQARSWRSFRGASAGTLTFQKDSR